MPQPGLSQEQIFDTRFEGRIRYKDRLQLCASEHCALNQHHDRKTQPLQPRILCTRSTILLGTVDEEVSRSVPADDRESDIGRRQV